MNRPWMPLYVADYRADTAHLNASQHGAYLLLIMHYWQTGGLPNGDEFMARVACMSTAEWRKTKPIIAPFFTDSWRHKRIDAEIARASDISSKRRASAEQRHSKQDANAELKHTHARASSPSQSHTQKKESCSNEFERFWKSYPRRVGKKAAEKALAKALRETSIDAILGAIVRQASSWNDPQFIPHPATWLNRGSWSDGEELRLPVKEFVPGPGLPTDAELRARYAAERSTIEGAAGTGADVVAPELRVHEKKSNGLDCDQDGHGGIRRMGEVFPVDEVEAVRRQDD